VGSFHDEAGKDQRSLRTKVRTEQIWDALLSDEALAALPDALARTVGGRSAILLYRSRAHQAQVLAFNHWGSQEIGRYAQSFASVDPWTEAVVRPGRENRFHLMSDFVSPERFSHSAMYSGFVQEMGDDTFHCIGASLSTPRGEGIIGVHRARSAPDFSPEERDRLQSFFPQLHHMFLARANGLEMAARTSTAEQALERLAVGALLVASGGRVIVANAHAERILASGQWLLLTSGIIRAVGDEAASFEALLYRATAANQATGGTLLMKSESGGLLQLDVSPARDPSQPCCAVVITRRLSRPNGIEPILRRSFGLTAAEAAVALCLAHGLSVASIADERRVAIDTVRMQIKAVLHKTGFTKTSALAVFLGQLSSLGDQTD